jgi:hypothetical protein
MYVFHKFDATPMAVVSQVSTAGYAVAIPCH